MTSPSSTSIDGDLDAPAIRAGSPIKEPRAKRGNPISFIRSIIVELRKVVWPSRKEVTRYSLVALFTLLLMVAIISVLDYAFSEGAIFLFK